MCQSCNCNCNKPQLLKLEVGKTYITESKIRVLVRFKSEFDSQTKGDFFYVGEFLDDYISPKGAIGRWSEFGVNASGNPKLNLIKEYREHRVHKRDIIWWKGWDGEMYCGSYSFGYQLNSGKELKRQTVEYIEE